MSLCSYCHIRRATWFYAPGEEVACCKCVPRGCSCQVEPDNWDGCEESEEEAWKEDNLIEFIDDFDRPLPCVEWMNIRHDKKTLRKMGFGKNEKKSRKWVDPKNKENIVDKE